MAVIRKIDPVGIDFEIDRMQAYFSSKMLFTGRTNEWLPRIYVNPSEKVDGKTPSAKRPEHFVGDWKSYEEKFTNDKIDIQCLFVAGATSTWNIQKGEYENTVGMIFNVNLTNLFPGILHRADEEFHTLFHNTWNNAPLRRKWELVSVETTVENVYREFDNTKIRLDDMHPRHVVRFNFNITYTPKCCTDC